MQKHLNNKIMHTQKQKDTINFLESLVHNRFNIDTLNTKLSEFFNEEIKAEYPIAIHLLNNI